MSIVGVFSQSRPSIGGIYFDAVLEESTELQTDVSEFPIEDGSVGNDHAVHRPLRLTMTIGMSDNKFRALRAAASELADQSAQTTSFGQLAGVAGGAHVGLQISQLSPAAAALAGLGASVANATTLNRSQGVLEAIRTLQRIGTLLTVVSAKGGTYKNCMITNTRQVTNKQNEGGLELIVEMVQVRLINEHNRKPPANPAPGDSAYYQAQHMVDLGKITMVPA